MIVVCLLYFSQKHLSSIWTLSLTPAGLDSKKITDFLIPDIMRGIVEGFDSRDAEETNWEHFWIFVDFYYSMQPNYGIRCNEHMLGALWTHCTFSYQNMYGTTDYDYTTNIFSGIVLNSQGLDKSIVL